MNSVNLVGNISSDIDLKALNTGKFVAKFNLAVNNPFNRDKVNFLPIEIWGKNAENTGNFCSKGSKVGITGYLEVEQWEKDGQKKYKTKVVASQVEFLTPKEQSNNQSQNQLGQQQSNNQGKSNFQQQKEDKWGDDPFANDSKPIDISDDDLPF